MKLVKVNQIIPFLIMVNEHQICATAIVFGGISPV